MAYSEEEKELFYQQLNSTIREVPAVDKMIILGDFKVGDFNARVGDDHRLLPEVLGKHGKGRANSNGELLLTMCTELQLAITNTYFEMPDKWYFTWQHPRSGHPHLLDYIITRRHDLKDIQVTRAMRGAEGDTDHALLRSILSLHLRRHAIQKS